MNKQEKWLHKYHACVYFEGTIISLDFRIPGRFYNTRVHGKTLLDVILLADTEITNELLRDKGRD